MNKRFASWQWWSAVVVLALAAILASAPAAAQPKTLPPPTGYLNDFAEVVDEAAAGQITAICAELDEKTGAQIGVASFPELGGEDIDGFTVRLFELWNPGQSGVNNGILIVDALSERQIRIEVGYGLEAIIPDAMAGRIRREVMTPLLAAGKHGEAYLAGVAALATLIAHAEGVTLESLSGVRTAAPNSESGGRAFPWPLLFFLLLLVFVRRRRGGRYRNGTHGGGPFIGGGFGGFGGGGGGSFGGFGGFGGGMSGGGGSSGGY